ncbi:alpha/beta hydrolase [Nitrospirillum sp. BR 11163]|uniref:alpha/beta fold hydrolase n=1 Tax=Nitrospirillum sp. BR 11163 TaxID=3104323 RepID=UPI002AFE0C1A|nr:alpha/beta hydrolase [Nitrospirillum sp. BR 11163]MEA1672666.1 alpha/beta hydrolase [Nitrospirillum sp. BR 11163]
MKKLITGIAAAATLGACLTTVAGAETVAKPTIVLVHGAFADASSWNGVIRILEKDGYPVVAAANPLRGVKSDAAAVADVVASIPGSVVLVGHSYGGSVISEAANGRANVRSLVFVAAFAPDAGETAAGLSGKFPGSTLAPTLAPAVALSDGGTDLYIQQERFPDQFAADLPVAEAKLMAATQRPITQAALGEASGEGAWHHVPSWFVYGDQDRNIPPQALAFMAERAHSHGTVVVKGGSHVVMVSHPATVAALIEKAAAGTAP